MQAKRVKTPTLIQMQATECGAAALGIILGYYGKYVPLEELRMECGVSRDGSNAYNMVIAAQHFGLDAKGFSMELDDLHEVQLPVILHWKFDHYVVLEGFDKKYVYLNDPATGPRKTTYEELDNSWTGVILTFTPTDKFHKSGHPQNAFVALASYIKRMKSPLIFSFLLGLLLFLFSLAIPALSQIFVDHVLIEQDSSWEYGIILGILIAMIASTFMTYLQGSILNRWQTALSLQLSSRTLWHMLRLPISFFSQRYPGEVASRLALNESISHSLTDSLAPTAISVLLASIYGVLIFYYDPLIAVIAIAIVLLNIVIMRTVYRARSDAYARYQSELGRSTSFSVGTILDIETIKASGMELRFFSRWAGFYTKVINTLQNVNKKKIIYDVMASFLDSLTTVILIGVGVWRIIDGHLTIGMFVALQILLRGFMAPTLNLVNFGQVTQLLKVDMNRINDLMKHKIDPTYAKKTSKEKITKKWIGKVEVHNLTFGYNPIKEPIFTDLTFTIEPGKSLALIGPTGCGKSTVAKLIAGLYQPWKGEILFDNVPLSHTFYNQLIQSLALVEQELFLFSGSIKENLTLLNPLIAQEAIISACTDACIHEEILSRPGGYEFILEENGANLSGGQRQRLEIARALAKNPTILILDEATSAIDTPTETKIIQNIKRRGCTLLVISHRLNTTQQCDEILNLKI